MKVGIEQAPSEFKPITLTLTFETREEFNTFKDVVSNISPINMEKARICSDTLPPFDVNLWQKINFKIYNLISRL